MTRLVVEKERELRMYYDERAGDSGGRVQAVREQRVVGVAPMPGRPGVQILVLGHLGPEARFAWKPMEEFADSFVCPVILVGPDNPRQVQLNGAAALISDKLGLPENAWHKVELVAG